jgi:DNA-binding response OmpR family regulator
MNQRPGNELIMLVGDSVDEFCRGLLPNLIDSGLAVILTTATGAPRVLRRTGVDAILGRGDSDLSPELCADLRALVSVPIVVLAPQESDPETWRAAGANEVLTAPVDFAELEESLRPLPGVRSAEHLGAVLHGPDGLLIDVVGRRVFALGRTLELTRLEFDLLECLLARRGEVFSADRLAEQVWSYTSVGGRNYNETQISRLRSKLRSAGLSNAITTVRGVGYVVR